MNPDDAERLEEEAKKLKYDFRIDAIAEMTKDFHVFTCLTYKKDPKVASNVISGVIASILINCCNNVDESLDFNDFLKDEIRVKIIEIDKILSKI